MTFDLDAMFEKKKCRRCEELFDRPKGSDYSECRACRMKPRLKNKYKRKK